MDPVEIEYFDWAPDDARVLIRMHLGALDGIVHDVIEGFGALPRRGAEVGGLLLGRVDDAAGPPTVWIEQYQRIPCEHRFGPQFVLDSNDTAALEEAAGNILRSGGLAVVGLYRSHTRPGFQLEEPDFELIRRYFSDPYDLILLVKPESLREISGRFYARDDGGGAAPVGEVFPFRGHVVTPDTPAPAPEPAATTVEPPAAQTPPAPREQLPRRLVPDFVPTPVEPSPSVFGLNGYGSHETPDDSEATRQRAADFVDDQTTRGAFTKGGLKKWLPLAGAMLLVGGIVWFLLQQGRHPLPSVSDAGANAPAQTAETGRPLGLYVDAAGPTWRALWNPNATALHDARNVQLFVREGDDQNRIDLSARDLATGSYQYRPVGSDVTFRLEVVDSAGRVSAESFRVMGAPKQAASAPKASAAPAAPKPTPTSSQPSGQPSAPAVRTTQPKAIYRAPPVVAAGVRPRIVGSFPVDVRVHIDARGHVVSAAPVTKQRSGLEEYLAARAVQAAKLWRFEPARENGKPVPGTQTIHFVFEK